MKNFNFEQLRDFEKRVVEAYESGKIRSPIHLSGGNEHELLTYFAEHYRPGDYVFSTWRSHYHALLAGVPEREVYERILQGHSIALNFPEYRFYASAIVAGLVPVALGVALALKRAKPRWLFTFHEPRPAVILEGESAEETRTFLRDYFAPSGIPNHNVRRFRAEHVHCFVGDMASRTGAFHEAAEFAWGHSLPITFIIENNGKSVNTPTEEVWGSNRPYAGPVNPHVYLYSYILTWPHSGTGKFVSMW